VLSEKEKFDQALGTILSNVDHAWKAIIRDYTSAKEAWDYLKEQVEGKESYTKIHFLQLLYNTRLDAESLEIDACLKSMRDVGLQLPEELIVLMVVLDEITDEAPECQAKGLREYFTEDGKLMKSRKHTVRSEWAPRATKSKIGISLRRFVACSLET